MFSNDPRDLTYTLSEMDRQSRIKANANRVEALGIVADWLRQDRRFDGYDHDRLAQRVQDCKSCGAQLDLSDPFLLRGGQRRPRDPAREWE
jgi:hypothetical protein